MNRLDVEVERLKVKVMMTFVIRPNMVKKTLSLVPL